MRNIAKLFALALSLCLISACTATKESTTQPQKPLVESTSSISETTETSEITMPSDEITQPIESTKEFTELTEETVFETEKPIEEKIVPLDISPQSITAKKGGLSELSALATLIQTCGELQTYEMAKYSWKKVSSLDDPLPASSFIRLWGGYPPIFINTISDSYLADRIAFTDYTDSSPSELYALIDNGTPVMVWVTKELLPPELIAEAEGIKMYDPHETVVLVGYSETSVMVWSPFQDDYATYERALFEQRFEEMGSFALTVSKK